jgi:polyhydroxybutyrate depolymerase
MANFDLNNLTTIMRNILGAAFLLLLVSFAKGQTITGTIMHDGIMRDYRLYVPSVYDGSEAVPLVFNLHGYTSNAFQQEAYGDFRPIADTANFLLVHPNGTQDQSGTTFWNAFGSPTETVDDVSFLSALIDSLNVEYNIDLNRVYSTGMSNGGFMSYRLACELGSRIAAIASVTGAMIDPALLACNPSHPTPAMQIHGTADPTVPYNGATGVLGAVASAEYWVGFNNCNPTPVETAVPDIDMTDLCTADHFVYSDGDAGSSVEFYRVNGGAHTWPGTNPFFATLGVTNQDFSASVEIWRFFSQYRLNELVGVLDLTDEEISFTIFPNPSDGDFQVRFQHQGNRTIELRDALGQSVGSFQTRESGFDLNIDGTGIYFLSVDQDGVRRSKKLIIE